MSSLFFLFFFFGCGIRLPRLSAGWTPTFVDLDIGQGQITIPGCLAATAVEDVIRSNDEASASATSKTTSSTSFDSPLVFFYGDVTPSDNPTLYKVMLARLNGLVQQRFMNSRQQSRARKGR